MTNSSSSSPPRQGRWFFTTVLVLLASFIGINLVVTVLVHHVFRRAADAISASPRTSLSANLVYFNVLKGLTITGLELRKDGVSILKVKRCDVGFDVPSLFQGKILVKNLRCRKATFDGTRLADAGAVMQELLRKASPNLGIYETVGFQLRDTSLTKSVAFDLSGYFTSLTGGLIISRGQLVFKHIRFAALPDIDFFSGSPFARPFDYTFEAGWKDDDLVITRFEVSNPRLKCTGSGGLYETAKTPQVRLELDCANILLEDFPILNQGQVHCQGVLDSTLKATGPLNNPETVLTWRLVNGECSISNALYLTKINGMASMTPERLAGEKVSLNLNNLPLTVDFIVSQNVALHISLRLASLDQSNGEPMFRTALSVDMNQGVWTGNAKGRFRFPAYGLSNALDYDAQGMRLGYDENLFLYARALSLTLSAESSPGGDIKGFNRTAALEHVFGTFTKFEGGFALDHLKAACYDGTMEGQVNFLPSEDNVRVKGEVHLRDVNLQRVSEAARDVAAQMKGKLDGDLRFDNMLVDQFKGQIFVTNGEIEKNPLLNAVADFLGVMSMKKLTFNDCSTFFSGGRGDYSAQVKLQSQLVNGVLDAKIASYNKMDGYLAVSLATRLLNESRTFNRLLTYIKHDQPSVVFSFKISSYLNSPRILWLKNEFKDKIQNLLPERNKRYLQGQVNAIVEKVKEE